VAAAGDHVLRLRPIRKGNMNRLTAATAFILASAPAVVLAQEPAAALSPFAGDLGNALWTVLIFFLVLVILGKFAWGPILAQLQARETFIADALGTAKRDREAAEASLKEYAEKLRQARADAEAIIAASRSDAEQLREEIKQKARTEADSIVKNAERQIQLETARALQQIRHEAVDLSVMIASKIIQRNLSKDDNQRLIDEALKQVEGRASQTN
jgi:F-type H+-transporting ATPase subunit b